MSRKCANCGRGPQAGASRSHSNVKSKRRVQINLQYKTINGKRAKVCTKCIKTLSKNAR